MFVVEQTIFDKHPDDVKRRFSFANPPPLTPRKCLAVGYLILYYCDQDCSYFDVETSYF